MIQPELLFECEICGTLMDARLCKSICPNCGRMLDCSDLPGMAANMRYDPERGEWSNRPEPVAPRPNEKQP